MTDFRLPTRALVALALAPAFSAHAQQAPDAGRALQETQPRTLQAPRPAPGVTLSPPAEPTALPGGATVTLKGVKLSGNSVFPEATLIALLGEVKGKTFDLAGLQSLARRITDHYRNHGYLFARAIIPAQNFADGVLALQIIEGRYGKVEAQGERAERAQGFLAHLKPGEVIESASLERAVLVLADQPGVKVSPIVRPGQELGSGDLIVEVSRERAFKSEAGIDNYGNRYTGQSRATANLQWDSPFLLGDQLLARLLYTEDDLWLGSLNYGLPLGYSGLRGSLGYSQTTYELGKDFRDLDAHGTAKVTSIGLSYPLLRSQAVNLSLGVFWQNKDLEDRQDATHTRNSKESDVLPVTLQFDRRDAWGITYGALVYTAGRLALDAQLDAADQASNTDTRGHFHKWNLDLARLQTTPIANLNLFGRASFQWAGKNLDSSESFFLGGAQGVRAYPPGEGNGDEGWLVQLEARYQMGRIEPFLFFDAGRVDIHAEPNRITPLVIDNTRSLAGSGPGLRYADGPLALEATLAWRHRGGAPQSETRDDQPRLWVAARWQF